jgi:hypothetical protein
LQGTNWGETSEKYCDGVVLLIISKLAVQNSKTVRTSGKAYRHLTALSNPKGFNHAPSVSDSLRFAAAALVLRAAFSRHCGCERQHVSNSKSAVVEE